MGNTQATPLDQTQNLQTQPQHQDQISVQESDNETEYNSVQESDNETDQSTCEICIEPYNPSNKFRNANKCSHPFCTDCVITYIRSKIEDDNTADIKCPALDCVNVLDPFDCATLIGAPLFIRWSDVLCNALIIDLDNCYCPYTSCNELILNECGGKQKKSRCPKCKRWFCFQCKSVWHSGFRCDESSQFRDANDLAFGRLAELNKWKRCPRCKHYCEKVDGCQIVKCRCGISFCIKCGRRSYGHVCRCAPCETCCPICVMVLIGLFCLGLLYVFYLFSRGFLSLIISSFYRTT